MTLLTLPPLSLGLHLPRTIYLCQDLFHCQIFLIIFLLISYKLHTARFCFLTLSNSLPCSGNWSIHTWNIFHFIASIYFMLISYLTSFLALYIYFLIFSLLFLPTLLFFFCSLLNLAWLFHAINYHLLIC